MKSEIEKIKYASRKPADNIVNILQELNAMDGQVSWELSQDQMGPCLHGKIEFKNARECLQFAEFIHELQEACDHHSNFIMNNFKEVDIQLSTHQPIPAITTVDVLFAQYIQAHY